MSEVWKYWLHLADEQQIEMPHDSDLLHVAEQEGVLTLWARVIPTGPMVRRGIVIRGTGQPIWQQPHVGTVLMPDGLVWHVFDNGEEVKP